MLAIVCNSINSLQNELPVDFPVCPELYRVKDHLHVEIARVEGRAGAIGKELG